eukprot:COSAG02_NODE_2492_length_8691_cov_45.293412_14_plen_92_part_01
MCNANASAGGISIYVFSLLYVSQIVLTLGRNPYLDLLLPSLAMAKSEAQKLGHPCVSSAAVQNIHSSSHPFLKCAPIAARVLSSAAAAATST